MNRKLATPKGFLQDYNVDKSSICQETRWFKAYIDRFVDIPTLTLDESALMRKKERDTDFFPTIKTAFFAIFAIDIRNQWSHYCKIQTIYPKIRENRNLLHPLKRKSATTLTHYRPALPFGNRKIYLSPSF